MGDCEHLYVPACDPHPLTVLAGTETLECVKCGRRFVRFPAADAPRS